MKSLLAFVSAAVHHRFLRVRPVGRYDPAGTGTALGRQGRHGLRQGREGPLRRRFRRPADLPWAAPSRATPSARIAGENRSKFSFPLETLEGKTVCVIGKIQRDASRAEIEVSSPAGLKLANIK